MKKIASIIRVDSSVVALCEDGSVWHIALGESKWHKFPNIGDHVCQKDGERFAKMEIVDLDISTRTKNALQRFGIRSVQQLKEMTEIELRELPSVGDRSIYEISQALAQ